MPSRGEEEWQTVTSTIVSPSRTMTAPSACLASLPVSMDRVCEPIDKIAFVHGLLSNSESLDDFAVAIGVLALQVVEQTATLADQLEQPAAGVVILRVRLEVIWSGS